MPPLSEVTEVSAPAAVQDGVAMDGRRFLAVALIDQQAGQVKGGLKNSQPG